MTHDCNRERERPRACCVSRYIRQGFFFSIRAGTVRPRVLERESGGSATPRSPIVRLAVVPRDYRPFISSSLSFVSATILDACSRRGGTRWGEIVNDASHGKSGSAGHAIPSPGEPLFNGALFMKLDVARPRIYLPTGRDNARRD